MFPHILWWQAWQQHIKDAHRYPESADAYCRAAVIAQMMYLTHSVIYWQEVKP